MTSYVESTGSNVPAFLSKLWILVEEETTDELICWDPSGKSFHVFDQGRFAKEILPLYFKHSNIASFIRQLNMYGFRKVTHVEQGGLKVEKDDLEFAHQYFIRGQEHLLEHIKRKISSGAKSDDMKVKPDDVNRVLVDVRSMKGKQENLSSKLDSMKRENEALWREVASLRQKHHKQQQIVNKLIQFLVTMVSNQRGLGTMKRKMPLMINDASQLEPSTKIQKLDSFEATSPNFTTNPTGGQGLRIYEVMDGSPTVPTQDGASVLASNQPPTEKAPTELSLDSILDAENDLAQQVPFISAAQFMPTTTPDSVISQPTALTVDTSILQDGSPPSTGALSKWVKPTASSSSQSSLAIAGQLQPTAALHSPKVEEVNDHLDGVQCDLDLLKDMLSSNQYNLDSSTILGLFNPEGPIPQSPDYSTLFANENLVNLISGNGDTSGQTEGQSTVGNELVSYDPNNDTYASMFDLPDPLLDDNSVGLLSDAPIGLTGSSSLNTPDVTPSTPSLTVTSPLASKRKKKSSSRVVAKSESVD